ncbi:MAG: hypothetical protein JO232_24170 [Verrucomicrobia bacterium]|nr:hypothetical protein [Verrucomicrobiota bacterium]
MINYDSLSFTIIQLWLFVSELYLILLNSNKYFSSKMPGEKTKRGPKEHPGPWGSKLWDHLQEIRSYRRARMKWKDIAAELGKKDPPVVITPAAVRNFFIRSRSPKLKLPAGLEHLRPNPEPEALNQQRTIKPNEPEPVKKRPIHEPEPETNKDPYDY